MPIQYLVCIHWRSDSIYHICFSAFKTALHGSKCGQFSTMYEHAGYSVGFFMNDHGSLPSEQSSTEEAIPPSTESM